jgi:hypothetical protein
MQDVKISAFGGYRIDKLVESTFDQRFQNVIEGRERTSARRVILSGNGYVELLRARCFLQNWRCRVEGDVDITYGGASKKPDLHF